MFKNAHRCVEKKAYIALDRPKVVTLAERVICCETRRPVRSLRRPRLEVAAVSADFRGSSAGAIPRTEGEGDALIQVLILDIRTLRLVALGDGRTG